jgi:hypothetical protein
MNHQGPVTQVTRVFILAFALAAALVSLSCEGGGGIGMGPNYGSRWGGGASGPSVIVGGPSR